MKNKLIEFEYRAINPVGKVVEGIKKAENEFDLQKDLKEENLNLIHAEPFSKTSLKSLWHRMQQMGSIKVHEKIILYRNLAAMIDAGLALSRALEIIQRQSKNPKFKQILGEINLKIKKGKALSEALQEYPNYFTKLSISMIQSGEESGNIVNALSVMADQMEKQYLLIKKVKGALIYPGVIVVAMTIIGIFMLIYVVPTLTKTFEEVGVELPATTRAIISFSDFVQNNLILAILLLLICVFAVYFGSKTKGGKKMIDLFFINMPLVAPLVKQINSARTSRILASLLKAGVPYIRSLQITKEVMQNHFYQKVLEQAEKNVEIGLPISSIFAKNEKLYPIFVGEMMAVGEETGELSQMLLKVAEYYENEVDQQTKNLSTVVEPVLMIVVGIAVGFFAISMISPMYTLVENI